MTEPTSIDPTTAAIHERCKEIYDDAINNLMRACQPVVLHLDAAVARGQSPEIIQAHIDDLPKQGVVIIRIETDYGGKYTGSLVVDDEQGNQTQFTQRFPIHPRELPTLLEKSFGVHICCHEMDIPAPDSSDALTNNN